MLSRHYVDLNSDHWLHIIVGTGEPSVAARIKIEINLWAYLQEVQARYLGLNPGL